MDFFQIINEDTGAAASIFETFREIFMVSAVVIVGSIAVQVLPDIYATGRRIFRRSAVAAAHVVEPQTSIRRGQPIARDSNQVQPKATLVEEKNAAGSNVSPVKNKVPAETPAEVADPQPTLETGVAASVVPREDVSNKAVSSCATAVDSNGKVDAKQVTVVASQAALDTAIDEFLAAEELLDEAISDVVIGAVLPTQPSAVPAAKQVTASDGGKKETSREAPMPPAQAASKPSAAKDGSSTSKQSAEKALAQRMLRGLSSQDEKVSAQKSPQQVVGGGDVKKPVEASPPLKQTVAKAAASSAQPKQPAAQSADDDSLLDDVLDTVSPKQQAPPASSTLKNGPLATSQPAQETKATSKPSTVLHEVKSSPTQTKTPKQASESTAVPATAAAVGAPMDHLLDDVFDTVHEQHECITDAILDSIVKD